jgi:hypothetical protein
LPAGECCSTLRRDGFAPLQLKLAVVHAADRIELPPLELAAAALPWCGGAFLDHLRLPSKAARGPVWAALSVSSRTGAGREGPPVNSAGVRLWCGGKVCGAAKTDANGEFVLAHPARGSYTVQVAARGAYAVEERGLQVWPAGISVYRLSPLERCPQGDGDPRKRKPRPVQFCE